MRINRFVLDNNIWISYFITDRQQKIVDIINLHGLTVFCCDELIAEFTAVLKYKHIQKYRVNIPKAIRVLKDITTHFTITYPIKNYIPDDVKDNYVIALACKPAVDSSPAATAIFYLKKKPWNKNIAN